MKINMIYVVFVGIYVLGNTINLSAQSASTSPQYVFLNTPGEAKVGSTLGTIYFKGLNSKNEMTDGAVIRTIVNRPGNNSIIPASFEFLTGVDGLKSRLYISEKGWLGVNTNNPNALLTIDLFGNETQNSLLFAAIGGQKSNPKSFQLLSTNTQLVASLDGSFFLRTGDLSVFDGNLRINKGNAIISNGDAIISNGDAIISSGSLSISTNRIPTGTQKLMVGGSIYCEEVKVAIQANWPDYVFSPAYQLPSILEVERFIKTKHHLPGIPSATEIKENGVELGEMQCKLLEKIEELTLYLIEQEKNIQALKIEIEHLKQK